MRYRPPDKIDLALAQQMLDGGAKVAAVARYFQVSSSAVYKRITEGKLSRRSEGDDAHESHGERGRANGRGGAPAGDGAGVADAREEPAEG